MNSEVPELVTRKPTGKPPWPLTLLAGVEKSGKSWSAAQFSGSTLVGRTFYIEIGEHYADEYGRIPGVRYKIVPHDGSYRDIGRAIWAASKQPRDPDGKPNCIIVDSLTPLWEMLSKQAHQTAYRRWRKKNPNAPEPLEEIVVTMDLWNIAKEKFGDIIDLLRQHDGPVIVTARLEEVAVVAGGKPTGAMKWKVQTEKSVPFEVDAVIQARTPRVFEITGLRSTQLELPVGKTIPLPGFTIEGFLRQLGHDQPDSTAPRSVTLARPDAAPQPQPPRSTALTPQQQRQLADWKRDLAILIGKKLGPDAARNRHAVMSRRFERTITSFDELNVPQLRAAIRELDAMDDYVPPRDAARYEELHQALGVALLEGIDGVMHAATDARDCGQITVEDWQQLSDLADGRAVALLADAAAERDWTPEAAGHPDAVPA